MIWLGWVLWHINNWRLFNAKFSLYIYIKYIWFDLVGISTVVGYLMPNPIYTYISNIYDLAGLGFIACQPLLVIQCQILSYLQDTHSIYSKPRWLVSTLNISLEGWKILQIFGSDNCSTISSIIGKLCINNFISRPRVTNKWVKN